MDNANVESYLAELNSKLAQEIEIDTKQIEFLKKKIEKNNELLKVLRARIHAADPSVKTTGYGAKSEKIKNAINLISKVRFIQADVEAEIKRAHPSEIINAPRIRSALWALQRKGDFIKQVRPGNNRQPAEFEKVMASTNGHSYPPPPKRKLPLPPQPVQL